MLMPDPRGEPMTAGDAGSPGRFEAALLDVLGYAGDPIGKIEAALADDPELVHGPPAARPHLPVRAAAGLRRQGRHQPRRGRGAGSDGRRRASGCTWPPPRAWAARRLRRRGRPRSTRCWPTHPRDLTGPDVRAPGRLLRRRRPAARAPPARALADWDARAARATATSSRCWRSGSRRPAPTPQAEALGRAAVAANPKDVWGIHAVGHVLEMQGRDEEGIAWYEAREADWAAPGCYFAVHNAWHLALYHVDREDPAAALAVYDRLLRPGTAQHPAQPVRRRGAALAAPPRRRRGRRALGGARRPDGAARARPRARVRRRPPGDGARRRRPRLRARRAAALAGGAGRRARASRRAMARLVGLPAARAMAAFAHGAYGAAVERLLALRPHARLMTGSARAARRARADADRGGAARPASSASPASCWSARLERKPRSAQIRRDLARCRPG